jgi:hypothetical protein
VAETRFRAARGGRVSVTFDEAAAALLGELLTQLLDLLDEGEEGTAQDPLDAAVGIGTATRAPEDPALARLLPDGYREDPEAAADFRRYTEPGLREAKRAAARTALETLAHVGARQTLTEHQAQAWLRALNDLRLALGTRLEVTEDWDHRLAGLAEDDPRYYAHAVYDHLTWLQETLVQALLRGS